MKTSLQLLLSSYRTLLEEIDAWYAGCQRRFPEQIRCAAGCSACCRGLFDISLLEAGLLQQGFATLAEPLRRQVLERARPRLAELQQRWPAFAAPWLLNHLPEEEWTAMPEDDLTPCPLLGSDGRCLVYAWRPMTCRLHGLPNIDLSGESFSDDCCSLNFVGANPLELVELRGEFRRIFAAEVTFYQRFNQELTGVARSELDTFIPSALFIDFAGTDWPAVLAALGLDG